MDANDEQWLARVAANVVQMSNDRGGAPMGWMAAVVRHEREARDAFGDAVVNAALEQAYKQAIDDALAGGKADEYTMTSIAHFREQLALTKTAATHP